MGQFDGVEEEYEENDVDVDEIEDIMRNVSLDHSISKIGRSPMGRLASRIHFQDEDVLSNYLSLVGGGLE
jgi:hypothetical protein